MFGIIIVITIQQAVACLLIIDGSWDVDYVDITSVTCSNKTYGFKVLKPSDDWDYYHPPDPFTTVSFISNGDTILYSAYTFTTQASIY